MFLARDAFVRTNRRGIAMMFARLFVCLSGTGVHCNHTVHFTRIQVYGWTGQCSGTLAPKHVHLLSVVFFQFQLEERWGVYRKSYMPRGLAQQRMTLSDPEWPFHTSRAISAVPELLVLLVASCSIAKIY